jgi:hypothetical protein
MEIYIDNCRQGTDEKACFYTLNRQKTGHISRFRLPKPSLIGWLGGSFYVLESIFRPFGQIKARPAIFQPILWSLELFLSADVARLQKSFILIFQSTLRKAL